MACEIPRYATTLFNSIISMQRRETYLRVLWDPTVIIQVRKILSKYNRQ